MAFAYFSYFLESVTFLGYLETSNLVSISTIKSDLAPFGADGVICLEDYLLGVADLTGELMRLAVHSVSQGDFDLCTNIGVFLRQLYGSTYHALDSSFFLVFYQLPHVDIKDLGSKLVVMNSSVEKVENVSYLLHLKGTEFSKEVLSKLLIDQNTESTETDAANTQ